VPENFTFGGGLNETNLHPAVLVAMLVAIAFMMLLPRKYILVPFLFTVILAPTGQEIYIAGAHVFVSRILILVGWVRIAWMKPSSRDDLVPGGLKFIDKAFVLWALCRTSAFMLLYHSTGALNNQVGFLWDVLGGYFLLRFLIRDREDISRIIKAFARIAAILAVAMVCEGVTGRNPFGLIGGHLAPLIRDGVPRSEGPFEHAILAGTFGAVSLPLFVWLWKRGDAKFLAVIGMIASWVIVLTSKSSTPLMALVAGIIALCFWPLREHMRLFRWGIVIILVSLHLAMKAPVWMLIARVDLVAGNSGYHRAELIDQSIRHFGEWWLIGTDNNQNWGLEMGDVGNQFIAEAVSGGLATLVCFIVMISWSFGRIGTARKSVRGKLKQEWMVWSLGAAMFAHVVAYFGISYFDQTRFAWYSLLAIVPIGTAAVMKPSAKVTEDEIGIGAIDSGLVHASASPQSATRGLFTS
jgi:hypothetical protein